MILYIIIYSILLYIIHHIHSDFGKNSTLTGKTLTNENLRSCSYDNTSSICKAKEMDCFDEEIKLCE